MIKFKNGSEIHTIKTKDSIRGNRSKNFIQGSPKIMDIIKDFILKIRRGGK